MQITPVGLCLHLESSIPIVSLFLKRDDIVPTTEVSIMKISTIIININYLIIIKGLKM